MAISDSEAKRLNISMPVTNDIKLGDVIKQLQEASGGEVSVSWEDVSSKPSEFPPSAHTHAITDVTDLQTELTEIKGRLDTLEGGS